MGQTCNLTELSTEEPELPISLTQTSKFAVMSAHRVDRLNSLIALGS